MDFFFASSLSGTKSRPVSLTRYYYTDQHLFEQSVDIYRPINHQDNDDKKKADNNNNENNNVIVLLTVGSGWMGHQPFIYRPCAWWNSSGPRTIASALGCPCVCIRHRGAYFHLPSSWTSSSWSSWMMFSVLPLMCAILAWYEMDEDSCECCRRWQTVIVFLLLWFIIVCGALLKWSAQGSATLEDMVGDVATAIQWVQTNKTRIVWNSDDSNGELVKEAAAGKDDHSNKSSNEDCKLVFGGYSSGGHVSATLLQRPASYWKQYGLLPTDELFSGILYISGVLAVQPSFLVDSNNNDSTATTGPGTGTTQQSALSHSHSSSSVSSQDEGRTGVDQMMMPLQSNYVSIGSLMSQTKQSPPPVWLTNLVCRLVWGPDWRQRVTSPIDELSSQQCTGIMRIPHLVIQNKHELFGLPWLDTFFCAGEYCNRLEQKKIPTIFRQVNSDHWNILSSRALYDAVQEDIPALLQMKQHWYINRQECVVEEDRYEWCVGPQVSHTVA